MGMRPLTSPEEEGGADIVSEINITPLVDVFLVLLIIFMVTSSVMSQMGMEVNLPKASAGSADAQPDGVIITLLAGGRVQLNGKDLPSTDIGTLEKQVRDALGKASSKTVILEGDKQAFWGSAIQIMDAAKRAGATQFAIATALEDQR
jgi:biopolymer transport protein ExbD